MGAVALLLLALHLGVEPAAAHTPHDDVADVAVSSGFAHDRTVFAVVRSRLMRSTDGGDTWAELMNGLATEEAVLRVAVAPSDEDVVYVATRGSGVMRSVDGGTSWQRADGGIAGRTPREIAVSPGSPDVVLAGGAAPGGGLLVTTDGGASWSPVSLPGPVTSLAFLPDGDRAVIGLAGGRVLVIDTQGRMPVAPQLIGDGAVSAVATEGRDGSSDTVFLADESGQVFRSDDAGGTYTPLGDGLPGEKVLSLELSPHYTDDATLWASTWSSGVFRSTDAGESWRSVSDGLTIDVQADDHGLSHFRGLGAGIDADGDLVLFVGGFDGLFRQHGGGGRWEEVQTLADYVVGLAVSPNFAEDGTIAVMSYVKGAFISRDGGDTWSSANDGLAADEGDPLNKFGPVRRMHDVIFSPDYADDGTIFSADWVRVVRSTDRGGSWTDVPVGAPPPEDHLRQFVLAASPAYAVDHTVFAATRHGEVFRSEDGGAVHTWTKLADLGERVRSLALSPDFARDRSIYAGTVSGVYASRDGGATWTASGPRMATVPEDGESATAALVAMSPAYGADGTAFAGTDAGLYVTRDGGDSWTEVTTPPLSDTSHVEAVAVSPDFAEDGTVLVSTRDLGLIRSTDGGASFDPAARDLLASHHLIADFHNPTSSPMQFSPAFARDRTVFAYAQTALLRSTDGGDSWDVLDLPSGSTVLESLPSSGSATLSRDTTSFETPIGNLSVKRVGGAMLAAVGCFAALTLFGVGGRHTARAHALHAAPSVLLLAVALALLAA